MSKKLTSCKACGEQISKKAKTCPHCGHKNKKPFFKKWWFWLIVVFFFAAIGSGGSDTENETVATTPPTTQVAATAPTTAPTEVATEATTEPSDEEETLSPEEASKLVVSMIELSISDKFDYYDVEGDATGIILSVSTNGIVQELTTAMYSGEGENYEPWVEAKESLTALCSSIYDSAVEFGMKDPAIMINVLNDQNHDNIILVIQNGVVVYDVMAD